MVTRHAVCQGAGWLLGMLAGYWVVTRHGFERLPI